jgi:hypothetical protein
MRPQRHRTDLRLQPKQIKLVTLHLPYQVLAHEEIAYARRRNRNNARHDIP